jgi:hypothetical protein
MDSPGHVDFQSEVTDSLLLSSFGLLLVDVCEGVLCRTVGVLRVLGSKDVVVFVNKIDRIQDEVWGIKVRRIVEDVNAVRCRTAAACEGEEGVGDGNEGRVKGIEVIVGSAKEGWGCSLVGMASRIMEHVKEGSNKKEGRKLARMIFEGKMGVRFDFDKGVVKVVKLRDEGKAEGWNMVKDIYDHCCDLADELNHVRKDKSSKDVLALARERFPYFLTQSSDKWPDKWARVNARCKAWKGGLIMQLICPLSREVVEGCARVAESGKLGSREEGGGKGEEGGGEGWIVCGRTRVEGGGETRRLVTNRKAQGRALTKGGKERTKEKNEGGRRNTTRQQQGNTILISNAPPLSARLVSAHRSGCY